MKQPAVSGTEKDSSQLVHKSLRYIAAGGAFFAFLVLPAIMVIVKNIECAKYFRTIVEFMGSAIQRFNAMSAAWFTIYWFVLFVALMVSISFYAAECLMNEKADDAARKLGQVDRCSEQTPEMQKACSRGDAFLCLAMVLSAVGWFLGPSSGVMRAVSSDNSYFAAQLTMAVVVSDLALPTILAAICMRLASTVRSPRRDLSDA